MKLYKDLHVVFPTRPLAEYVFVSCHDDLSKREVRFLLNAMIYN